MLPSKMMPTNSPCAVDDRAAGVAADDVGGADEVERRRQVRACPSWSTQRGGRSNGGVVLVLAARCVQAGEGGLERDLLAVLLVALHDAEGQPQRERWRPGRCWCLRGRTGPWRSGRRPGASASPWASTILRTARASGSTSAGQFDHRVVGRVDRRLAALIQLRRVAATASLVPRDSFGGAVARRLAGEHLLHERDVAAQAVRPGRSANRPA